MDESKREAIIKDAMNDFGQLLMDVAADIYDSCIKLYYHTYSPKYYGRHGKKEGFNLYSANDLMYNEVAQVLRFHTDEYELLPYGGKEDKRELILNLVMSGVRGSKVRRVNTAVANTGNWPKKWRATYPNKFSKYHRWKSGAKTMDAIFDEFIDQVEEGSDNMNEWFFEILYTKV